MSTAVAYRGNEYTNFENSFFATAHFAYHKIHYLFVVLSPAFSSRLFMGCHGDYRKTIVTNKLEQRYVHVYAGLIPMPQLCG